MTLEDDVIGIGNYRYFFAKVTVSPHIRYFNDHRIKSVLRKVKRINTSDPYTLVIPRELME